MTSFTFRTLSVFVVFACFALPGCKKDNPNTTTTTTRGNYSFICWNKTAGFITNFQSNNTRFAEHWDFGDGETLDAAGSSSPRNHTYIAPGIYTVTLIVNNDTADKVTQADTILPNFAFYYTGLPIIGDTLFFHFHAFLPTGTFYLWTFGDGSSTTDSIPWHIYSSSNNFVVKLTINGNPADPDIWDQIQVYQDPVYTHLMTNTRLWHGSTHTYRTYDSASYNVRSPLPDSSFALNYIDELTVGYNFSNCTFTPSLSTGNTIVFTSGTAPNYTTSIYYDHVKDSVSIFSMTVEGGLGNPPTTYETRWHSP